VSFFYFFLSVNFPVSVLETAVSLVMSLGQIIIGGSGYLCLCGVLFVCVCVLCVVRVFVCLSVHVRGAVRLHG